MGMYYKNAVLTLAAGSSQDVQESFLQPTQRHDDTITTFKFRDSTGQEYPVLCRQVPDYAGISLVSNSALASRGWTWQENVLSTRIAHFTKSGIVWECRSGQKFQDGATISCTAGLCYRFANASGTLEHRWKALIADYSERELTKDTDRLPAIAGVASETHLQDPSGTYMAGIWKQWLFSELLWYTSWGERNNFPPKPISLDDMPSWSWASTVCRIFYRFEACEKSEKRAAFTLLDFDCTPRTSNIYGQVKRHASITLEALLFEVQLSGLQSTNGSGHSILVDGARPAYAVISPDSILLEEEDEDFEFLANASLPDLSLVRRIRPGEPLPGGDSGVSATALCMYLGGGRYVGVPDEKFPRLRSVTERHFYLLLGPVHGYPSAPNLVLSRLGMLEMGVKPPRTATRRRVALL